jgi:ribonuclease HII
VIRAAARVSVAIRSVRAIDGRGLHVSNLAALSDCLRAVAREETICLVDGFSLPCELPHTAVIDGDARSAAIASASVVAKVTRDRYMRRAAELYPGWNFEGNVGYSTPEHREAIVTNGISPLHRRSFASVAYSQLELSERVLDVIEGEDLTTVTDGHPDDVEAELIEAEARRIAEPGASEAA